MITQIARWWLWRQRRRLNTMAWCPACGLELISSDSFVSDTDLVRYRCTGCGHESAWLFDAPAPLLIADSQALGQ